MHATLGNHYTPQTSANGRNALVQQLGRGSKSPYPKQESQCETEAQLSQRLVTLAEEELRRRRLRYSHLPRDLFGEAAWSMLLDLFICQHRGQTMSASSACLASDVPNTTARRWLDVLESQGLVERPCVGDDRDEQHVSLSAAGYEAVCSILTSY